MDILRDLPHAFLGSRLKRFAEQLQAEASVLARGVGVSVPAGLYPILALLEKSDGYTIGELARDVRLSQPAVTKSIHKLIKEGLVVSSKGSTDRRQSKLLLTEAGRVAIDRGRKLVWPLIEKVIIGLLSEGKGSFLEQLEILETCLAEESLVERASRINAVNLSPARGSDVGEVVSLLNRAYRSEGDDAGWTTEAGLISGDRISEATLQTEIAQKTQATLLVWKNGDKVIGCVWVEPMDTRTWYLGSLAVDPKAQNTQFGRRLLSAAEQWCQARGAQSIHMTVLEARETLIAWYERRGYGKSGETEPFPDDDNRFGTPTRSGLRFAVMTKDLDTLDTALFDKQFEGPKG